MPERSRNRLAAGLTAALLVVIAIGAVAAGVWVVNSRRAWTAGQKADAAAWTSVRTQTQWLATDIGLEETQSQGPCSTDSDAVSRITWSSDDKDWARISPIVVARLASEGWAAAPEDETGEMSVTKIVAGREVVISVANLGPNADNARVWLAFTPQYCSPL